MRATHLGRLASEALPAPSEGGAGPFFSMPTPSEGGAGFSSTMPAPSEGGAGFSSTMPAPIQKEYLIKHVSGEVSTVFAVLICSL